MEELWIVQREMRGGEGVEEEEHKMVERDKYLHPMYMYDYMNGVTTFVYNQRNEKLYSICVQ